MGQFGCMLFPLSSLVVSSSDMQSNHRYATAAEHNVLYQYQFSNTKNVFMAMIQTETP